MKKKLLALALVCVMILSGIPVYAARANFTMDVQPVQESVEVGDTVYYSIVAKGEDLVALQFDLVIPKGLRYVAGSAATPEDLREKLGVASADWTEGSMMFTYYNDVGVDIP